MIGKLRRHALDGKNRCRHDRLRTKIVARACGPREFEATIGPTTCYFDLLNLDKTEPRGLQHGRDGRTNDVLAALGPPGMAGGEKRRQPLPTVSANMEFDHESLGGQLNLIDTNFRKALTVTDQLADALLGLVLEDEDFLVFRLTKNGPGHGGARNERRSDGDGISAATGKNDSIESNGRTNFEVDRIATNQIAFTHAELLAIRLDDCVHNWGRLSHVDPVGQRAIAYPACRRSRRYEVLFGRCDLRIAFSRRRSLAKTNFKASKPARASFRAATAMPQPP